MSPQRPVTYPPRRGHPVMDLVTLSVGLLVILVAGGIAIVALAAVFAFTPHATDPRHADVDAARALIESSDAPSVRAVAVRPNVFGRRTLYVALVRRAWTAEARSVWCDVILPTGIGREFVRVDGSGGQWRAPADCMDPASKPEFLAPYD